jgi:hypothetical protein
MLLRRRPCTVIMTRLRIGWLSLRISHVSVCGRGVSNPPLGEFEGGGVLCTPASKPVRLEWRVLDHPPPHDSEIDSPRP